MSRFEHELRALGKRQIGLPELRAAYFQAYPEALDAPDGRRLLLEALQALERNGVAELPKQGWDRSGSPALPRTAKLRVGASPGGTPEPHAWLPALAFAGEERHPVRRRDLEAINAFLLATRDRIICSVPTRERSLEVFGDEKRLDKLRKGGSSLFEGRVSLDDLKCYPVAPPLPYETPEKPAPRKAILVLENYHSFDSFRRWNRKTALYAAVAYGGGNAFHQGAGNLDDVMERIDADGTVYVGDLDPAGVKILIDVNTRRQEEGRAALRPHRGLYRWLVEHGRRCPLDAAPGAELGQQLGKTFPTDVVIALLELWSGRERVPQESFGLQQLGGREAAVASPEAA